MTKTSKTLVGLLRQLMGRSEQSIPQATLQTPAPRRDFVIPLKALTPSAHLDRVSTIVRISFARVEAVNGAQALARQQLDVADYALQLLLEELRIVMPGQFSGEFRGELKLVPIHAAHAYGSPNARIAA
jgi:hypothetical protein